MDRQAYVWTFQNQTKQWKPTLVALRFTKAASCAAWNASGTKFAAGSSNGSLAVGHYDSENDWWVCKHLKTEAAIDCTITCVSWHPNNVDLIFGTVEGHVYIQSGYIKSVDG